MVQCGFCSTQIGTDDDRIEIDDVRTISVGEYVEAWVCPNCDSILGVGERLERAAEVVGDPTRIVAAPDCGFGTLAGWERVDTEIGWRKLEVMVDGAALASESLY